MAPVVRIDPSGIQTLLSYDNTRNDLERNSWHLFIEKFKGFNLRVAQEFALTFDGFRAKIGDMQLEVTEEFLSQATGLPAVGKKWFKNIKVEEVPWTLMFTSRKITSCDRGMPVSSLKPRWHDLLDIVKQFITCEGRFGLVFLYHLRLLMSFIGFPLNMPYFLLRSLYKMGKRFRRKRYNSSLFHHGLIKIILVHQLQLHNDYWDAFFLRNGFGNSELGQVDKPIVIETLVKPTASSPPLLPCDPTPNIEPSTYPDVTQPDNQLGSHPKSCTKTVKKPIGKKPKGSVDVDYKNKRVGRLISRCTRNKSKPCADKKNTIEVSEDSDLEIERFLAEEDPMSYGLCPDRPYTYVSNLPPCLKDNPEFPDIRFCDKPTFRMDTSPILNAVSANA
jgi:hypothetical protein